MDESIAVANLFWVKKEEIKEGRKAGSASKQNRPSPSSTSFPGPFFPSQGKGPGNKVALSLAQDLDLSLTSITLKDSQYTPL